MNQIFILLPIALGLGLIGLIAFVWSIYNGQYDDVEGSAMRILDDEDAPLPDAPCRDTSRRDNHNEINGKN